MDIQPSPFHNLNSSLSLTITPIIKYTNEDRFKGPDLTFHCICCGDVFDHPQLLYDHMGRAHSNLNTNQQSSTDEMEDDDEDCFEYSSIMEPICELVHSDSSDDEDTNEQFNSSRETQIEPINLNMKRENQGLPHVQIMDHDEEVSSDSSNGPFLQQTAYERWQESKERQSRANESLCFPEIYHYRKADDSKQIINNCFQCSQCEKSFQNAGDLAKHVRSHTLNKPYQCSICDKTFTHIGSLNTHIRIHSGEKPYKCDICSKAFTQSSSLMVHIRSHTVKKPHQCHLCDKGFINSSSLVLHLKTHAEGNTYPCPECDKEFKHSSMLAEHMRLHTYDLVYQCSICRKAFKHSSELVQHMKCHTGEKPFQCSICEKSFTQPGSLNTHMRIHTGERPFHCKICDKSFTQASSLTVHMKIHSGERPHRCHICNKSYSQQSYLNKHIQFHMDNDRSETMACIVCGALFRDTFRLAEHVTKDHSNLLRDVRNRQRN